MAALDFECELQKLISAFKELKSPRTRRALVMLVEELVQKEQAGKPLRKGD